jgi:UDP-N-acetylmuramoyl-L-alanyl-D-glutamate--2,6-diaminopimelate ligase
LHLIDLIAQSTDIADASGQARDPVIAGLSSDSRAVRPGFLFAALPGSKVDGSQFIGDAVARGAVAVLAVPGTTLPAGTEGIVLIEDAEPRRRLSRMAAAFFGRQPAVVAAVTGTNGKTSTVQFTRQIWSRLGHKAGCLGTLGITAPGLDRYGSLTTPDTVGLHQVLAELADAGVDHLAMEASSHGLDQYRLDGVVLTAAGFTNLTRDHLDYHGSMDAYAAAKALLFSRVLPADGAAVLNAEEPASADFALICAGRGQRILDYGTGASAIALRNLVPLPHGQHLTLDILGTRHEIDLPLAGRFQCMNALCALGLVIGSGADVAQAVAALEHLEGVRGRLEQVATHPAGAPIYVDYAHTPDALETVLKALRPHTAGRLVVVFGCGGDRDRGKRPVMGDLARRLADTVIVTDDNPRSEIPAEIRREALAGCPDALEIGDRALAIHTAVSGLGPDDLLVIAGKGHEQGQIVGSEVRPFDDAQTARAAVAEEAA